MVVMSLCPIDLLMYLYTLTYVLLSLSELRRDKKFFVQIYIFSDLSNDNHICLNGLVSFGQQSFRGILIRWTEQARTA